jgi:tetratricopeptide (TPR) repeat protein
MQIANWVKYAKWEESIGELQRARSVFERGLDIDHRNVTVWLQYAEMEMRNKQVNHARNIWDRAITILPRATQFWLKYTYMEELIGNVPGARQVPMPLLKQYFNNFTISLRYLNAGWNGNLTNRLGKHSLILNCATKKLIEPETFIKFPQIFLIILIQKNYLAFPAYSWS